MIPDAVLDTGNAADIAMCVAPATPPSGVPQLSLAYGSDETLIGTCPECKSQLEFAKAA